MVAEIPAAGSADARREVNELGVIHTWGSGPEVLFLSNPLADAVGWSSEVRAELLRMGYRVSTFEHRPASSSWTDVVDGVVELLAGRPAPVALVGWSQGAAIAQEVALAAGEHVAAAVLLATYGRQNAIDQVLQAAWDALLEQRADPVRLALALLTSFPPDMLADDEFVQHMQSTQPDWAGHPDLEARRRAAGFISTYQQRLSALEGIKVPCLVIGFELDTDTFARRAREVARAIPMSEYVEIPGQGHAAPLSNPHQVWPHAVRFLERHFPP